MKSLGNTNLKNVTMVRNQLVAFQFVGYFGYILIFV